MHTLLWIAVFASVGCVVGALTDLEQWEEFKKTHGKHYPHPATDAYHYAIFQQSLKKVEEHNAKYEAGEVTYSIKLIHLSDIPEDQWPVLPPLPISDNFVEDDFSEDVGNKTVPDAIDWREKGYVTHVKNQGCEDCYLFASIAALEGFNRRVNGKLVALSEQNVRECYRSEHDTCNGGDPRIVVDFIVHNQSGLIDPENLYPFTDKFGQCKFNKTDAVNTHVQGTKRTSGEDNLKTVVGTIGPVVISFHATPAFGNAHKGIFYDPTCKKHDKINHAVVVVGYGTELGEGYWIIKNSWASDWGDGGYLKIARNRDNNCRVADVVMYLV
uniref:Pept_C1 domain-containing protein n=1 Tax=Panagrellus redivivus TaxID=6233 RepID=A0A7E4UT52_PANRE